MDSGVLEVQLIVRAGSVRFSSCGKEGQNIRSLATSASFSGTTTRSYGRYNQSSMYWACLKVCSCLDMPRTHHMRHPYWMAKILSDLSKHGGVVILLLLPISYLSSTVSPRLSPGKLQMKHIQDACFCCFVH